MRVLIFHGYLLRGTGSNVYNAELAQALLAEGHDVDLVCQQRDAHQFDWVDAAGRWENTGELAVEDFERPRAPRRGRCTVYNPPIADLLPVYVQDEYPGFDARTFDRLDDEEVEFYIARNVMAVRAVVERSRPDFGLANHMIMGPHILHEAFTDQIPYVVKLHGSAMEYIVRPHPRFLSAARSGVDSAAAVLVGSRHTAERAWELLRIEGLEKRIWLGPPGVDTKRFRPLARSEARRDLAEQSELLAAVAREGSGPAQEQQVEAIYERVRISAHAAGGITPQAAAASIHLMQQEYVNDGIDFTASDRLRALASAEGPLALYVGKLIASKGVDLLIAAWPLVLAEHPEAKLLVVGFGAQRESLEMLLRALADGDLTTARWIAEAGRELEGGEAGPLPILVGFFDGLEGEERERYLAAAKQLREAVLFTGRLGHPEIARITPSATCQLVPSTFPEAFGMVAAEAAACGVPPICAAHSGLQEVTERLQQNLSGVAASILSFRVSPSSVQQIASRVHTAFTLSPGRRGELSARLVKTAEEEFSWAGVARTLLAAGSGETGRLRHP